LQAPFGHRAGSVRFSRFLHLSQHEAERLAVDLLVYPEDTYLVVDPYSEADNPLQSWLKVTQEAELQLPRPMGEVRLCQSGAVRARFVLNMVVLDFEALPPVRPEVLESALHRVFRQAIRLRVRSLCLDRLELVEKTLSAYRIVKSIQQALQGVWAGSAGCLLDAVILTLVPGPCWRRFEMALSHLNGDP
jgi:hypothetical protein